jgi:Ran GTPase-activating protein (RanGAP) involved in mRNA processing and transport
MLLGPKSAYVISNILQSKREVAQVNLKKNCLGDKGIMNLAECLKPGKLCVEVEPEEAENCSQLSKNETAGSQYQTSKQETSFDGKIYLPKSEIVSLELGENEITHIGAQYLFEALSKNQTIISLNLGNTESSNKNKIGPKGAQYLHDMLLQNQLIQFLDLQANVLGD